MMTASIRPFQVADQAAVRALVEEGLGEHFGHIDRDANPDLVDIAATYARPPHAFFVAELDGTLVGTTGLLVEGHTGRLVRVAVARDRRRSGIATLLLNHVAEFARGARLSRLVAHTQPEWPDAMRFYRSHGFVPYGCDTVDVYLHRPVVVTSAQRPVAELGL